MNSSKIGRHAVVVFAMSVMTLLGATVASADTDSGATGNDTIQTPGNHDVPATPCDTPWGG